MTDTADNDARIAALEAAVTDLTRELRELRENADAAAAMRSRAAEELETRRTRPRSVAAATASRHVAAAPAGFIERRHALPDADALTTSLSRHGLALLASLVFLSGLGILIRWAVSVGHFGPSAQLAAGAALTTTFYALGAWLWTTGDERRGFARVVFSLALAATHLIAWGAGPRLQLLPDSVALGIVVLCALSLGLLAHRADDGTLFAVGVGGALAAPLLAGIPRSPAGGDGLTLYLATVFLTGVFAVSGRPWRHSMLVLALSLAGYCAMLAAWTLDASLDASWRALLPAELAFVTALATRAAPPTPLQVGLARAAALTLAGLAVLLVSRETAAWVQWAAVVAALAAMRIALDRGDAAPLARSGELRERWQVAIDGLVLPGLLLFAAAGADTELTGDAGSWRRSGALAVVGLVLADSLRVISTPLVIRLRAASVVAAATMLAIALPVADDLTGILVLALSTAVAVSLALAAPAGGTHPAAQGSLFAGWVVGWVVVALAALATTGSGYTDIPGATWPLATLLAGAPALAVLVRAGVLSVDEEHRLLSSPRLVGGAMLLAWAWLSIAHWRSPLAATTGTIVYEAAVGAALLVAAILRPAGYGRLRATGLWTLGFAGVHTLVQVWGLEDELVKVLVTLLVGSVLLATAYVTRRRTSATA